MRLIIILLIIILVFCLFENKSENFDVSPSEVNGQGLYYQPVTTVPYNEIDSYAKLYKTKFYNPNMVNTYANEVAYDLSNPFPNPGINIQLPDPSSYSLRETSDGEIEGIISPN